MPRYPPSSTPTTDSHPSTLKRVAWTILGILRPKTWGSSSARSIFRSTVAATLIPGTRPSILSYCIPLAPVCHLAWVGPSSNVRLDLLGIGDVELRECERDEEQDEPGHQAHMPNVLPVPCLQGLSLTLHESRAFLPVFRLDMRILALPTIIQVIFCLA